MWHLHDTITLVLVSLFLLYQLPILERQFRAIKMYNNASTNLDMWRKYNPDLCVGDIAYARKLVIRRIKAYTYTCKVCPWITMDEGYIESLLALLFEHNPEPPRKRYPLTNNLRNQGCFIFDTQHRNASYVQ